MILSAFIANSAKSQIIESSVIRTAQAETLDAKKTTGGAPSDSSKSLPAIVPEANKQSTSYYRRSDSYATNPESDPPRYVRRLSDIGVEAFKDVTWLDIGFESRMRYEHRHNDVRRIEGGNDDPFVLRQRAWIGIRDILDPFRFAVEFQDSRMYHNKHPTTDQEKNEFDLLNAYGELHFKKGLGVDDRNQDRPIRFRVGRMAYETTDRRFIATLRGNRATSDFSMMGNGSMIARDVEALYLIKKNGDLVLRASNRLNKQKLPEHD